MAQSPRSVFLSFRQQRGNTRPARSRQPAGPGLQGRRPSANDMRWGRRAALLRRHGWLLVPGVLGAVLAGPSPVRAQAPPGWGSLKPEAPVGFMVVRVEDPTRAYGPLPEPAPAWGPRPLQLGVWYPARSRGADTPPPMTLGEVVDLRATELGEEFGGPGARAEARQDLLRGPIDPYLEEGADPQAELARVTSSLVLSRRDAPPAAGRHPVVLHTGVLHTQVLLNEYLASRGYVVIGVPLMGSSPAWRGRGEPGPAMWEAIADDIAASLAAATELPFADPERSAVIGMLAGAGLLQAMRDPRIDAVALLDAWLPPDLRALPGWAPRDARAPILVLRNTVPGRSDGAPLDSMVFATRVEVTVDSLTHPDFYPFARYVQPDEADERWPGYGIVARHTAAFLDEVLRGGPTLEAPVVSDPDGRATHVRRHPARSAPPLERSLLSWARYGRAAETLAAVEEALAADPLSRPVDPGALVTVARFLWRDGERAEAEAVARAVVLLDPENAWASEVVGRASDGGR